MRLLGCVRLSDLTDETTSPARQKARITDYAKLHDHQVVHVTEDLDVSGIVRPQNRPELGPWLADPDKLSQWDALIVAKHDRLSRSLFHFMDFCRWLEDQGKTLICIEPEIDLSTAHGRLFAQMLFSFAEYEREMISGRVKDSYDHLRRQGKFPGGTVPWGYMPVRAGTEGWQLVPDPAIKPIVEEMVARYLDGHSLHALADWLNEARIPQSRDAQRLRKGQAAQGKAWTPSIVRRILSSPVLVGRVMVKGEPLRDADGMQVRITPLIPEADYQRLQAELKERAYSHRSNASRLLDVSFCALCGAKYYVTTVASKRPDGTKEYVYYVCQNRRQSRCPVLNIRAADLERMAEEEFLARVGGTDVLQRVDIPAEDHGGELASVAEAIENLEDVYAGGTVYQGADGAQRFARMMTRLEERRARLAALPSSPARTEYRSTGTTFRARWAELADDPDGRRMLMIKAGFRYHAARVRGPELPGAAPRHHHRTTRGEDIWVTVCELDPELAERAGVAASGLPVTVPAQDPAALDAVLAPLREMLGGTAGNSAVRQISSGGRGRKGK
jgi:site-specific DNA recombinase